MSKADDLAEYHRDPCGWCINELRSPDADVRCNAADILRGLAFDAVAAIPTLKPKHDHGAFPTKEQGLQILCEMRRDGGPTYLGAKDLIDPWGNQLPCGPDGQSETADDIVEMAEHVPKKLGKK